MKARHITRAQRNFGLTNILGSLRKFAAMAVAGIGLMAASLTAQAAVVNAVFTNLGGGGGNIIPQPLKLSTTSLVQ